MSTRKAPLIIAHRGSSAVAPENTMAAFTKAIEMGSDMIELDVQRSKDGHIVVIHDHTLKRTTNGTGLVRDHTLAELQELDAGSWFGEEFAGEPIPTLREVLEAIRGKCAVNIEIKNLPYPDPGVEQELVDLLADVEFPLDDVVVSCFDHFCLATLEKIEPKIPTAVLFSHYPASLAGLDTKILHPSWQVMRPDFVNWVRESNRLVNVWTVDNPERWEKLINDGVNGLITNVPDQLRDYLKENGISRT